MPPFLSTSKTVCSFLSRKNGSMGHLLRTSKNKPQLHNFDRFRCLRSIVDIRNPCPHECRGTRKGNSNPSLGCFSNVSNFVQKRELLGCGDGEESGVLSKVYEERRVLGYSPEQLFDVVAAVDLYHGFVPWCQRSDILKYYPDGSFDAELEIGFKFLVESYVSHVELDRPRFIQTTASESRLFDHLVNIWKFNPGPIAGTCDLYVLVDFKFQSPFYRQVASMFFKEVVSRLVGSFSDRCRLIYGPGVPVLEDTYGQRS